MTSEKWWFAEFWEKCSVWRTTIKKYQWLNCTKTVSIEKHVKKSIKTYRQISKAHVLVLILWHHQPLTRRFSEEEPGNLPKILKHNFLKTRFSRKPNAGIKQNFRDLLLGAKSFEFNFYFKKTGLCIIWLSKCKWGWVLAVKMTYRIVSKTTISIVVRIVIYIIYNIIIIIH